MTALAGLALAGCGGAGSRTTASHPVASAAPVPARPQRTLVAHAPALAPHPQPPPGVGALRRTLTRVLAQAGPASGAYVYDLTAQAVLFAERANVGRPPASVEKLYTTVALLGTLGPHTRLHTSVLGSGYLGRGGTWHGDVYLRGGGDPTFGDGAFNRTWEQGYGPTATQLAAQLRRRGIRRVTGHVIGDGSLFDRRRGGMSTAFAPDLPDFGGQLSALTYDHGSTLGVPTPEAFAARQLARTLRAQGVAVRAARAPAVTPPGARVLAVVSSPPLSVLLRLMDVPSDDLFAEMLTKQLGVRFGARGSIHAGAGVIADRVADYGLHPRILDGSGLSRADASSPRQVVDLLRGVWHTPVGDGLSASLPVVGVSGTVQAMGVKSAAQGHCIAKTGTLDQVTNLAGYCAARRRQAIAFAVFLDGPQNWQGYALLGRMAGAIARY